MQCLPQSQCVKPLRKVSVILQQKVPRYLPRCFFALTVWRVVHTLYFTQQVGVGWICPPFCQVYVHATPMQLSKPMMWVGEEANLYPHGTERLEGKLGWVHPPDLWCPAGSAGKGEWSLLPTTGAQQSLNPPWITPDHMLKEGEPVCGLWRCAQCFPACSFGKSGLLWHARWLTCCMESCGVYLAGICKWSARMRGSCLYGWLQSKSQAWLHIWGPSLVEGGADARRKMLSEVLHNMLLRGISRRSLPTNPPLAGVGEKKFMLLQTWCKCHGSLANNRRGWHDTWVLSQVGQSVTCVLWSWRKASCMCSVLISECGKCCDWSEENWLEGC